MTDPARALAEMARVLQPGGRMAVTDIIVREDCDGEFQIALSACAIHRTPPRRARRISEP